MNYCLLKYSSKSLQQRTVVEVVGIQTGSGSAHIVLLKMRIIADLIVKFVDFLCSSYLMIEEEEEEFSLSLSQSMDIFLNRCDKRKKKALATGREREENM